MQQQEIPILKNIENNKAARRNSWLFVPTQYFAEGIPFVLVNQLSVAMYKSFEASNIFIGMTSFLYLPWSVKFLWGPWVDAKSTKRNWVTSMQLILAISIGLLGFGMNTSFVLPLSLILFTVIAFVSATHDIATDGFYLHALDKKDQALFTGIRSTFYRFAMIFAGGLLVTLAGEIGAGKNSIQFGWSVSFYISAAIFFLLYVYHRQVLPYPDTDRPVNDNNRVPYARIFREYFNQEKIGIILAFILLFRFGEAMLLKMAQPFLLDKAAAGGMSLSLGEVGIVYGTVGVIAMVVGGILGGLIIKRFGLKKLLFPLALAIHLPNVLYIWLAAARPDFVAQIDVSWLTTALGFGDLVLRFHPLVQLCIVVEQFGYGLGFTAFMVYLLYISRGPFKTSHYAISTGLMAIGMMVPGFLSGIVQSWLGYLGLFIVSSILTIPGIITIFFLPYDNE